MPIADSDPRVFFAAERTLLAWLRTGLTIMGIGFVIARFGLFLDLFALQAHTVPGSHAMSAALGMTFVLLGALTTLISALQHRRFVRTLVAVDMPPAYSSQMAVALSLGVAVLGFLLAAYLLLSVS